MVTFTIWLGNVNAGLITWGFIEHTYLSSTNYILCGLGKLI